MFLLVVCTQAPPFSDTAAGDLAFELDVQRLVFEDTVIGESATLPFTLTNVGEVAGQAWWSTGATDFPGSGNTTWLEPGGAHVQHVTFQPQHAGERVGSLVVTWSEGWSAIEDTAASLSGFALAPLPYVTPTEVRLEAVVGCAATQAILVENRGDATMVVSRFEVQGASQLHLETDPAVLLEPSETHTADLVFEPDSTDRLEATVFLETDRTEHAIPVTAQGLEGEGC